MKATLINTPEASFIKIPKKVIIDNKLTSILDLETKESKKHLYIKIGDTSELLSLLQKINIKTKKVKNTHSPRFEELTKPLSSTWKIGA